MKRFLKKISKKEQKLSKFFEKKELEKLEKVYYDLDEQHRELKEHLKEVNYLLDLIEKHDIQADEVSVERKKNKEKSRWLKKLRDSFEKFHLLHTDTLSAADIEFLRKEKNKLQFEKDQLEKEEHHIIVLMVKAKIYLMDARNLVCKEITKGYDIASTGEKLLEHFGKKLKDSVSYESGRKIFMRFFEEHFDMDRIRSKELFDLLEKSNVISYTPDYSNLIEIPNYSSFNEYTNINYMPLFGDWYINA